MTTMTFTMLIKGQPGEAFHLERDIRQGNPIFSYILFYVSNT